MKNNKLFIILTNILNKNSASLVNFLISFIIIKLNTVDLWGQFVYYMALVQIVGVLGSWGSKDYLLKEFSLHPNRIAHLWQENILSRSFLLLIPCLLFLFLFPLDVAIFLILWSIIQYISKSYEVFIFYHRSYIYSLVVELICVFIVILLIFYYKNDLTINHLLFIYLLSGLVRLIMYAFYFKMDHQILLRRNFNHLRFSFSFFLLTMVGILNSRVDLFCINYTMNKSDLGSFQVFFSFILLIQNVGHLLIEPFAKNLYRMKDQSVKKIKWILILSGPVLTFILIVLANLIISKVYGMFFNLRIYIYGFLFCLPVFVYSINIYNLFKHNNQLWLVYISVVSLLLTIILNIYTIPYWGIEGVILSGMLVQWLKLIFFMVVDRFILRKVEAIEVIQLNSL